MPNLTKFCVVTDVDLSSKCNSGNKNAVVTLIDFLSGLDDCEVDLIYIHRNKLSVDFSGRPVNVFWVNNYLSVVFRKVKVALAALLGKRVDMFGYAHSYWVSARVARLVCGAQYRAIFVEYAYLSYLIPVLRSSSDTLICDLHDIFYKRTESYQRVGQKVPANFFVEKERELRILRRYDAILAIQKDERISLKGELLSNVICTPRPSLRKQGDVVVVKKPLCLGLIGNNADFNVDGIEWFLDHYLSVCRELGVRVIVAGAFSTYALNTAGVECLGVVNDVRQFYEKITVMFNPIRFGSGLKTKNIESLSYAVPVITTPVGIEGMRDFIGAGLDVVDESEKFRDVLIRLCDEDVLLATRMKALETYKNFFSGEKCFAELGAFLAVSN